MIVRVFGFGNGYSVGQKEDGPHFGHSKTVSLLFIKTLSTTLCGKHSDRVSQH
jgi:hypothetical protein